MIESIILKFKEKTINLVILFSLTFILSFIYFTINIFTENSKLIEEKFKLESSENMKFTKINKEDIKDNIIENDSEAIIYKELLQNEIKEQKISKIFNNKKINNINYEKPLENKKIENKLKPIKNENKKVYYIQGTATKNKDYLNININKLKQNGFSYKIASTFNKDNEPIDKILIGPYTDLNIVNENILKINKLLNVNSFVFKK